MMPQKDEIFQFQFQRLFLFKKIGGVYFDD